MLRAGRRPAFGSNKKLDQELSMSFGFKNIGHFFATVAGDIVKGARGGERHV